MRARLLGGVVAALLAVGCGGGDGDEEAGGDAPTTTTTTTEATTTTVEETTTTTEPPPGGIDCLVGEMELVTAGSSAPLAGSEVTFGKGFPGLDDIHVVWEIAGDAVVAPATGELKPLTFPVTDDGLGPTVTVGTMVLLLEDGGDGEVTIGTFGGAQFDLVMPGSKTVTPIRDDDLYAVLLPLDEPATVTCPEGEDVTIEGPTTTTTLRPVDPPELTPVLEEILAG